MRSTFFVILLSLMAATAASATARLGLNECINNALANNPAIRAARENLNAAEGRTVQAASQYQPQIMASSGYSENRAIGGAFGDTVTKNYTTTLSVNQTLYDFGKTGNALDSAKFGAQSAGLDIDRAVQDVVLNVKQAYYALLHAKKLLGVAQKTLGQAESHLQQAETFFRAGSKPRFDVTRAEVDVNNAKLGLINAGNSVRINTVALYNAMGLNPVRDVEIEDILARPESLPSPDAAQAEALKSRPEMRKIEADILAARSRVKTEQSNYLPKLSVNAAYNWAQGTQQMGPFKGDIQDNWNAGIMVSLPIFEGWLTKGRVGEALANQNVVEAQRDTLSQSILLEVNQAYADIESAVARIAVMESSLKSARESLALAEGRYQAGAGPSLEVTDALVASAKTETDYLQALYDYELATAKLLKAMGKGF